MARFERANRIQVSIQKVGDSLFQRGRPHASLIVCQEFRGELDVGVYEIQEDVVQHNIFRNPNRDITVGVGLWMPQIADNVPHDTLRAMCQGRLSPKRGDLGRPWRSNGNRAHLKRD